jgi:hypothetical protein
LEHENLPITEDGCFLAYKAINRDYTDKYTGTISNKVGDKVKMPYEEVTADPTKHCSSGLHCGSIEYVRNYGNFKTDENNEHTGDRLVTVKVNPSAVVSVPEDSDRQKVRVYRYVVHEEIENPYDLVPKYEAPVYYDSEGNVYDEDYDDFETWDDDDEYSWETHGECKDEEGHDDSNLYSERGIEGEPGNPVEGLIDFDDPQRSESIIAGCVRQSTDNPVNNPTFNREKFHPIDNPSFASNVEKNSFDQYDIDGEIDIDMINAMYNNIDYANEQPSEKNSFDSVEKTNNSESFTYGWNGVANTEWDVVHNVNNDKRREDMHPKAREIFEYYENKYGMNVTDSVTIDSIIGDLKDAGFDMSGNPLEESNDQKNFLDEMFQDASCYAKNNTEKNSFDKVETQSNEESVVKVETPNNIILPDNN